MLSFIKRFFHKNNTQEIPLEDLYITNFLDPNSNIFTEETGDGYKSFYDDGLNLQLQRKQLYAWCEELKFQYKDLLLESTIDFSSINQLVSDSTGDENNISGFCAFGFLLRYVNDSNFYSVLISDGGYFRMDVMFNGNQIPLIGWTLIPVSQNSDKNIINLKIIANSTNFCIIINDKTCCNIEDDTIQSEGYVAFAGQNWQMHEKICAKLKYLKIDRRDIFIDSSYRQWSHIDEITPEQNLANTHSFASVGNYIAALLELESLWKKQKPTIDELLLASRLYLSQNMYENAQKFVLQALDIDNNNVSVQEQYASLLYLWKNFYELENYLNNIDCNKSSLLLSFYGHVKFQQKDYNKALEYYENAYKIDNKQIIHKLNMALCYEQLNKKALSFENRFECALLYLEQKNYNEFENTIILIENAKPTAKQKKLISFLKGRLYFLLNDYKKSLDFLQDFLQTYNDKIKKSDFEIYSLLFFMLSKIYRQALDANQSLIFAEKSCIYNENNVEYLTNYAELLFSLKDYKKSEEIALKSTEINIDNGYAWNLLASIALINNDLENAQKYIFNALSTMPEDLSVLKNYIIIMQKQQRFEEAFGVLDDAAKHSGYGANYRGQALHLTANLLKNLDRYEEAENRYKEALLLCPKNQQLIADYASLCIFTNRLNEADSLLCKTLTEQDIPTEDIIHLLVIISNKKGDFSRSEVLLREYIEEYKNRNIPCPTLYFDLGNLYISINKVSKSEQIAELLKEEKYFEEYNQLISIINSKTKEEISCSKCKIKWYYPKNMLPIGKLNLTAQPPDNLPAGICINCGKIYCIGCGKQNLDTTGRFRCLECGEYLKIQHNGVAYILNDWKNQKLLKDNIDESDRKNLVY